MKKKIFAALAVAAISLSAATGSAQAADAAKGKKLFKTKCGICHATKAGKKKVGPSMFAVVGRKAATEKFKYSKNMKKSGLTWDEATLDKWLTKPNALVKGTKMAFPGLKKPKQRANIIAYLNTLK